MEVASELRRMVFKVYPLTLYSLGCGLGLEWGPARGRTARELRVEAVLPLFGALLMSICLSVVSSEDSGFGVDAEVITVGVSGTGLSLLRVEDQLRKMNRKNCFLSMP